MEIIPRSYQLEALVAILQAVRKVRLALLVMATGLGKTVVAALAVKKLNQYPGIVLVHDNGILANNMVEFRKVFGKSLKFGIYNGRKKDIEGVHIIFATFQSMQNNLSTFGRRKFKWMWVDEGHHGPARTFKEVIDHFWCVKMAMTATPARTDLQDISEIFGRAVYDLSLEQAIARGLLPPIEYHLVTDRAFSDRELARLARRVIDKGERVSMREVNSRIFIKARDKKIVRTIRKYGPRAVIFCRNIYHTEDMKKLVVNGKTYHSGNSHSKNQSALEAFSVGRECDLLAVNAFNEGHHLPDTKLVVFNRVTESSTVFYQQLGRGLHPGQKKLTVLDFVGSAQRILEVKDLADRIAKFHEKFTPPAERAREGYVKNRFHLSGKGFRFTFADRVVKILDVMARLNVELYRTCQEASAATIRLGIKNRPQYDELSRKDPRLPADPYAAYVDFPGFRRFCGLQPKEFYETCQEASKAAIYLGIRKQADYNGKYKKDVRLPSSPATYYKDFPGWETFLAKKYPTWQEASKATIALKIKSGTEYVRAKKYLGDPRLPADPSAYYADFPGWVVFLGGKPKSFYRTCQKASKAAQKLAITSIRKYKKLYKKDPRLCAHPQVYYPDFPGWKKFLGKKPRNFYKTCQRASRAARKLGIKNSLEYPKRYSEDPRLPCDLWRAYPDFPGFPKFLGKT